MLPYDSERDLRIVEAMAGQLESYLISDELFWRELVDILPQAEARQE